MTSDDYLEIDCRHGKGIASVVCGHLRASTISVGFIENSSDPNSLQGWCFACEHMFLEEGDRTDRFLSFNKAEAVCEKCYSELKELHTTKPIRHTSTGA